MLEVLRPEIIVEIGSDYGRNTRHLLDFCQRYDARLHVIDPQPKYDVATWQEQYGERLAFHQTLSLNALPQIERCDVVLIDGDHNWYTVYNELKLIERHCTRLARPFPLVLLHDVGWPYGRRDVYYNPENIPDAYRHPCRQGGMHPESAELLREGGLNQHLCNAIYENTLRNGVLTAVDDFLQETEQQLGLVKIPGIHGLGILTSLRLKEQNKEFAQLLEALDLPLFVERHVERTEKARLEIEIQRQKLRIELQSLRQEQQRLEDASQGKEQQLQSKDRQISDLERQLEELERGRAAEAKRIRQQLADKDEQLASKERQLVQRDEQLVNKDRQLERKDEQLADKDKRLVEKEKQLASKDKRIAKLQAQLSAIELDRSRRTREVEMLAHWFERLNIATSALLDSWRWRVGNKLGEIWRRALLQPRVPMAQDQLRQVAEEFRARYEGFEQDESVRIKSQDVGTNTATSPVALDDSKAGGQEKAPSPSPLSVTTFKLRRFDSAEHVLDALRDSQPVTIIVPIHNAYEDLKMFLLSVTRNTTAPARLLLIDDASTDARIQHLLAEYEGLENVRVLINEENLGFSGTLNRGFAESSGDVVIVNSDVEVTPRWLENLSLAAHANPRTATVTAISNRAGAFSVPEVGKENDTPEGLQKDDVGRLISQQSGQVYPYAPTGNGFCMYIKRAVLDEVGLLDAASFPRGYAEENEFCMRAQKRGWNHVVDDTTFVFHKRSASFGSNKKELLATARKTLDELHPEYTRLARLFVASDAMKKVGRNVKAAYESLEPGVRRIRPRVLFVIHDASGGTPHTNRDLMSALADRYSPYLLLSDALRLKLFRYGSEGLELLEEWSLSSKHEVTEFSRPDYRAIVFDLLIKYRFELVHIRHLLGHTFDLPEVAARLRIPVVLSFHDFYFSCPTIHLIDDHGKHCGGICTPGSGRQCTIPTIRLKELPVLKHAWLNTWRWQVEKMFSHVDAFVTTSQAAKEVYLRSLPSLRGHRFQVIEHGRNLKQERLAVPPGEGPVRILVPGNINLGKGAAFIRELERIDREGRLEFHFLGKLAPEFKNLGINHGPYVREEFSNHVREIGPSFVGIFSIWPETYCHTLTEAWAAGLPVLASNIGTLKERIEAHGGGWLIDHGDPDRAYEQILAIAGDPAEYARESKHANLKGIKSTKEMSDEYEGLYRAVLRERQQFTPPTRKPLQSQTLITNPEQR